MAKETSKEPEGKIDYSLLAIYSNKQVFSRAEACIYIGFAPESSAARRCFKVTGLSLSYRIC